MKLKVRLAMTMVASTAVVLAACFAGVFGLVLHDETRDLDAALMAQAAVVAMEAVAGDATKPGAMGTEAELPRAYGGSPAFVAIYDPQGQVVSKTRSFADQPPTLVALGVTSPAGASGTTVDFLHKGIRLRGVVLPVGKHGHTLLYATIRDSIDEDTAYLFKVLAGLFAGALFVSGLAAIWLGKRLARDVDGIAVVATAVAKGDLSARVGDRAWGSVETRALAHSLNDMVDQLAELVEGQRVFISHAAHELRSPLATLRGELQLALRRPRQAEEYRNTLEDALAEAEALSSLADDLLTLTRVGRSEPPPGVKTKVGAIVEEALRMARGVAEARRVKLEEPARDSPAWEVEVRGARTDLARALRNLIDNAVTHSPQNAIVHVLAGRFGNKVRFSVIDTGPGVSRADKSNIFHAFFRGERECAGEQGGTGLGLAIARGIVRACGGDLTLDVDFRLGAKFDIVLPVYHAHAAFGTAATSSPPPPT